MNEPVLMIDFRDEKGNMVRKMIDDCEFGVRNGRAFFDSHGERYDIPVENIIQMYMM